MKKLLAKDIKKNSEIYDYVTYLGNPNFWFGTHKDDNYARLTKITEFTKIPLKGTKCLDVGCGTGDLFLFLKERGVNDYLGIDIYKPSLDAARQKYPAGKFEFMDILEWNTHKSFDYVFCSGSLSTNLESDNYEFIESMIRKMWSIARIGVSLNFITESLPWLDPTIFHYSPERVIEICKKTIGANSRIFYRIIDGEAHVYMWKDQQQLS